MSEISAKPEELRQHARNMRDRANTARTEFDQLRTRLQQLSEQFKGSAATAFDGRYQDWNTNANQLIQALEGLGDWLGKAAETVEKVDSELASGLG